MTFNQMRDELEKERKFDHYIPTLIEHTNKCEKMVFDEIDVELQRFKRFEEKGIDFVMHTKDMIEFLQEQKKRIKGDKK